ncbi:MAG TPA: GNAT family N-acetyltransferase [Ktedonobacterales bacterium]|nr:GNAT family N-acetyltransferase [Ktedonobacterales bacterium]
MIELVTEDQWREAFPVMHELRTHLDEVSFIALLREMAPQGYRLLAVRDEGAIKALAGIARLTNLYYGRHIWVYDLITTAAARSRGYGEALLGHVERMARELDCDTVALASGLQRLDAHRFYEQRMGYSRTAYTFQKSLR